MDAGYIDLYTQNKLEIFGKDILNSRNDHNYILSKTSDKTTQKI